MTIVMFYHSLLSDWNHGNAHFLRGVVSELQARGHEVRIYEPADAWSRQNLIAEHGPAAIEGFYAAYPGLDSHQYDLQTLDLDAALDGADLVIVHEWSEHELVRRIGAHRAASNDSSGRGTYRLLFHDTHHRSVTDPESMAAYDLTHYDGVLAFGRLIRDLYLERGWAARAWVWHEAADTRVFHPMDSIGPEGDLVWIGNWGDEERTAELHEFLLEPVKQLGIKARVYGVRYPDTALAALADAGIEYDGWLPNYRVPEVFSRFKVTIHVPRRPYVEALPGIPTIRVFEALACGIPLVSAPWNDVEGLFTPGEDYLTARSGEEMTACLRRLLGSAEERAHLAAHGRQTLLARHTCRDRVDELLAIDRELQEAGGGPRSRRSNGTRVAIRAISREDQLPADGAKALRPPVPEGQPALAQAFMPGNGRTTSPSPGGTTEMEIGPRDPGEHAGPDLAAAGLIGRRESGSTLPHSKMPPAARVDALTVLRRSGHSLAPREAGSRSFEKRVTP